MSGRKAKLGIKSPMIRRMCNPGACYRLENKRVNPEWFSHPELSFLSHVILLLCISLFSGYRTFQNIHWESRILLCFIGVNCFVGVDC